MINNAKSSPTFNNKWTCFYDGAVFFSCSTALTKAASSLHWANNPLSLQGWALSSLVQTASIGAARSLAHLNNKSSVYAKIASHLVGFLAGAAVLYAISKPLSLYTAIQLSPKAIAKATFFHATIKTVSETCLYLFKAHHFASRVEVTPTPDKKSVRDLPSKEIKQTHDHSWQSTSIKVKSLILATLLGSAVMLYHAPSFQASQISPSLDNAPPILPSFDNPICSFFSNESYPLESPVLFSLQNEHSIALPLDDSLDSQQISFNNTKNYPMVPYAKKRAFFLKSQFFTSRKVSKMIRAIWMRSSAIVWKMFAHQVCLLSPKVPHSKLAMPLLNKTPDWTELFNQTKSIKVSYNPITWLDYPTSILLVIAATLFGIFSRRKKTIQNTNAPTSFSPYPQTPQNRRTCLSPSSPINGVEISPGVTTTIGQSELIYWEGEQNVLRNNQKKIRSFMVTNINNNNSIYFAIEHDQKKYCVYSTSQTPSTPGPQNITPAQMNLHSYTDLDGAKGRIFNHYIKSIFNVDQHTKLPKHLKSLKDTIFTIINDWDKQKDLQQALLFDE